MRRALSSITGRLLLGSGLFTLVVLTITLGVMHAVFDRFVRGQIDQRLDAKLAVLAFEVRMDANKRLRLEGTADPGAIDRPNRGFWWISGPNGDLHSETPGADTFVAPTPAQFDALPAPPPRRSLREAGEDAATREADERPRALDDVGPDGRAIHMRIMRQSVEGTPLLLLAAVPEEAIRHPVQEAMARVAGALIALGAVFAAALLLLVRLGLAPLARLRADVAAVRDGTIGKLPLGQPREIMPLVVELNSLLDKNAANLALARSHVANLAHGLVTPLATLSLGIERLGGAQTPALQSLVASIERRIRHHLGRARAAALAGPARVRTPLLERLRDIFGALEKIYAGKALSTTLTCPPDLAVACESNDVDEILGNLLDNAFKYTNRLVECRVDVDGPRVVVEIADDGPGLREEELGRVMRHGQRLDEDVPGFGFGLPIARELTELYAGELVFEKGRRAGKAGLVVILTLPRAGS